MARICVNCGCEIPIMGKSLKLKSADAEFCTVCRKQAEAFLNSLKDYEKDISDIGMEFDCRIEDSDFSEHVREILKKEFDYLYLDRYAKCYIVRNFNADFHTAYQTISQAVSSAQGFMGESYDTCVVEKNGVKSATFLITDYTTLFRDSYAVLAVNLIHHDNEATVITTGANEALGDFQKLDKRLWKCIAVIDPNLRITIVRKPELKMEDTDGETVR